jgi:subtilase family serine protease
MFRVKNVFAKALSSALVSGAVLVAAGTANAEPVGIDSVLAPVKHKFVCATPTVADTARCHAHIVVDDFGAPVSHATPSGYGPSSLRSAYNITSNGSSNITVAIVDAYGYSNAENDLAVYRSQYGLPACTTLNGCFKKVNQNGVQGSYPSNNAGWSQETALDMDMVSAMCPNCKILLVQANSASYADLATAEDTAAALGAHVISNSYGGAESSSSKNYEASYTHAGVAITVSSGDSGYGVQYPASSPHVTAVGGTSLKTASGTRGWSETVWSGAGSGCSTVYAKPSWQNDTGCSKRTVADVSAVADPNTGVAVYTVNSRGTSSTWYVFGGTSVAAPVIAGVYGVNGGGVSYGSDPYKYAGTSFLNDVTSGSNGSCSGSYLCTGKVGYDGPSGLGTPWGATAF